MKENITNKIYWALSALFLLIYFFVVYQNTINIPQHDDFPAFLNFLSEFIQSSSISEKINLIFSQHGEHRILFTRLIVVINYWVTGKINISTFTVISNLFLFGIGILFCLFIKQKQNISLFVLLMILLLFNGQNYETSIWTMAGLANVGTLLLVMLSIYFVTQRKTSHFAIGLVLSIITIFSNGNGICLLPALAFSLFLQKRKKELVYFLVFAGIASIGYFLNYHKPASSPPSYLELLKTIHIPIINFFNFIGCNFWIPSLKIVSFIFGLFIFFTYVLAFYLKFYKKNIAWFSFFTFMLLTAAALVLNRNDSEGMGPLRYRIYGSMYSILTVIFYFENREKWHLKHLFKIAVPAVVIFGLSCDLLYYDKTEKKETEWRKLSAYHWQYDKTGLLYREPAATTILQKAEELGIYIMPPAFPLIEMVSKVEKKPNKWKNLASNIRYDIDTVEEKSDYLLIRGWAYAEETTMNFMDISIWLLNEEHEIKIHPYFERRDDITYDDNKMGCGFFAIIPKNDIPTGEYALGIEMQRKYIFPVKTFTTATNVHINNAAEISYSVF